ncbi:MAG: hypothetical protein K1X35_14910 [Caulobacteraceae bacterium]|nr:hypothetical protein [Caulobacteraceae bacterium]
MTVRLCARLLAAGLLALVASPLAARPGESLGDLPVVVRPVTAEDIQRSRLAVDVIAELNAVRTNPQAASQAYQQSRPTLRGLSRSDFADTIQFLDGAQPRAALRYSPALSDIASLHARDLGLNGLASHVGSDGSTLGVRFNRRGVTTISRRRSCPSARATGATSSSSCSPTPGCRASRTASTCSSQPSPTSASAARGTAGSAGYAWWSCPRPSSPRRRP